MLPAMAPKPKIAIVGPGRLGTALALQLKRAGYTVSEVLSHNNARSRQKARALARKVGAVQWAESNASLEADLIWFCVPDRQIAATARDFSLRAKWKGKIAFHSSGALSSNELDALRRRGAAVASVHPMMTFVQGSIPSLEDVPFAAEGDAPAMRSARRIARDLGGEAFTIRPRHKAAYHAWGAFASPLLVALLVTGERLARSAGLSAADARRKMMPILKQTLANYARLGPAGAFSGPIIRGDAEVVRKHLRALSKVPGGRDVYLALARVALRYLPARNRKELSRALASRLTPLGAVEIGDKVRVTDFPPSVKEMELQTRSVFKRCVGKVFPVTGFQKGLIELEVGRVVGKFPATHSIWIEPDFLQRAGDE